MQSWQRVKKIMLRYFSELRWYSVIFLMIFYIISSYLLLYLSDEYSLLAFNDFFYWLIVTGSTVGYGDMSPSTTLGKWVVAIWVIPVGLSIFALILGRIATWVGNQWQKGAKGLATLNVKNHILLLGWNGHRTEQLLKLLLIEKQNFTSKPTIVLCVRADISNPMPGEVEFVKVNSFNHDEDMDRACIAHAATILIDNPEDDLTMTSALYCSQRNKSAHKVAYFKDESLGKLLQIHCPEIECTPSVAVEMIAKSAFDPGSSLLHHDLLNVNEGQAQYSVTIPNKAPKLTVDDIFQKLKTQYNAIFIGISEAANKQAIKVNPPLDQALQNGDKIFYIAENRINDIDWSSFDKNRIEVDNKI